MNSTIRNLILFLFLAVVSAGAIQAVTITPSNKYVTRKLTTGTFDAIRTNTSIDVVYTVGPRSIEVYAPDNLIDYIKVSVKGSELTVNYKENMNIKGNHKSCVRVSAPDVKTFTTASAGDITIKSPINLANSTVTMTCLSAGDIDALSIEARQVSLTSSSAGDIETKNIKAEDISLSCNSAGDIETGAVTVTGNATLKTNSAGDIDITRLLAGTEVIALANSAGKIEIDAVNTEKADFSSNSAGDIVVKDIKANIIKGSVNSAGSVSLSGNCDVADFSSRSTGAVKASGLKANKVTASVYSLGEVKCQALESLDAIRKGMGSIQYAGSPANITVDDPRGGGVIKL